MRNKLRNTQENSGVADDIFAIDTILSMLAGNTFSHNEPSIDLGEWGDDYKLFSFDGFAYAINNQYILYLTYPLIKNLTKDEKKDILVYRFGEEGARDKRKPRTGDVCLYFGRVVASKVNKTGQPLYTVTDIDESLIKTRIENGLLVAIESKSGQIGYVPKDLSEDILNSLLTKYPQGL
jgi:hypothetical protein